MKNIVTYIAAAVIVLLAVTGYSVLFTATHTVTGYGLLLHATLAPVFSLGIAIWAVWAASRNRFSANDGAWLLSRFGWSGAEIVPSPLPLVARKACFWLVLVTAVSTILSVALNMFPLFSMDWQPLLALMHRCSVSFLILGILGYAGSAHAIVRE